MSGTVELMQGDSAMRVRRTKQSAGRVAERPPPKNMVNSRRRQNSKKSSEFESGRIFRKLVFDELPGSEMRTEFKIQSVFLPERAEKPVK